MNASRLPLAMALRDSVRPNTKNEAKFSTISYIILAWLSQGH
jgi:hypothetical protein